MIQLQGVQKTYGQKTIIHTLDISFKEGSTTVLIGPSGCGKSTLLRLIIGLLQPNQGKVFFNNVEVSKSTVETIRQKIGYVIQDGGLFPHLTARQNVGLMAKQLGWSQEKRDKRIDELGQLTHLYKEVLDRYPAQLSGGQKQRVSLMRALMLNPDVLLLDEPLGALDPIIRRELQDELREIFQVLNKTVVLVTHDLGEAAYFSDQIVLMKDGRIIQQGPINDLMNKPASDYVTTFVQSQRSLIDEVAP